MKFSIITVCKNTEKTIEDTILSVLNQSYKNFEHIIIDGVSTDSTLNIAKKYQDKVAKIISEPDEGLYDAMNKGIQNASGDYLFFLNADDKFLDENVLQKISELGTDSELIYGDQVFVNNEGEFSKRKHNKLNKIYLMKNTPCQPATFYKREAFDKYGLFDTNFKIVSDQEWFLRTFLNHKITSQYTGFAITAFSTGEGLSTSSLGKERLNIERDKMFDMYFTQAERKKLEFAAKHLRCFTTMPVVKDILNPFFGFDLYA